MLYQKENYEPLIKEALDYIFGNLSRLNPDHLVTFRIMFPKKDTFLKCAVRKYVTMFTDNSDWITIYGHRYYETKHEMTLKAEEIYKTRETEDDIYDFFNAATEASPVLERLFNLPSLDKKKEDFDITKKSSVKEKQAARQYRKGQRVSSSVKKINNNYKRAKNELKYDDEEFDIKNYI